VGLGGMRPGRQAVDKMRRFSQFIRSEERPRRSFKGLMRFSGASPAVHTNLLLPMVPIRSLHL
jgi:hypothetical protein